MDCKINFPKCFTGFWKCWKYYLFQKKSKSYVSTCSTTSMFCLVFMFHMDYRMSWEIVDVKCCIEVGSKILQWAKCISSLGGIFSLDVLLVVVIFQNWSSSVAISCSRSWNLRFSTDVGRTCKSCKPMFAAFSPVCTYVWMWYCSGLKLGQLIGNRQQFLKLNKNI